MPSSDPSGETPPPLQIRYGAPAFERAAQALDDPVPDAPFMVLHGGTREERQQALARLTRHATGALHQFRMPALLSERRMQTQNAMRKAFDHAAEEGALLYFDAVDALFHHRHEDPLDGEGEEEPTAVEYFFDRVAAFPDAVVLGVKDDGIAADIRDRGARFVVRFEA